MVVIAIITVLATFIIPNVGTGRARAQQAKCLNNVRTLLTAAIVDSTDNQGSFVNFPSTLSSLFDGRNLDPSTADCPAGSSVATVTYDASDNATLADGEYSLVVGMTSTVPGTNPLVYDTADNHGGYNVGYVGGYVKFSTSAPTPSGGTTVVTS